MSATPGTGVDGKPRTLDRWVEQGREEAFISVVGFVMSQRINGFSDTEVLEALIDYGTGNLMLTGGTWRP